MTILKNPKTSRIELQGAEVKQDFNEPSKTSSIINLFVTGEITGDMSEHLVKYFMEIEDQNRNSEDEATPIQLIINTPGGDAFATWMICDVMSTMTTPIYTLGLGQVASGGFMIFMNGTAGLRTATVNTHFMTHRFNVVVEGSHSDYTYRNPEMNRMYDRMLKHYRRCTGLSIKDIEKYLLTEHDVFLDANQCKNLGVCDNVVDTTGNPSRGTLRKLNKDGTERQKQKRISK
jgi:ATP-dependent Clp protease protease subunit